MGWRRNVGELADQTIRVQLHEELPLCSFEVDTNKCAIAVHFGEGDLFDFSKLEQDDGCSFPELFRIHTLRPAREEGFEGLKVATRDDLCDSQDGVEKGAVGWFGIHDNHFGGGSTTGQLNRNLDTPPAGNDRPSCRPIGEPYILQVVKDGGFSNSSGCRQ